MLATRCVADGDESRLRVSRFAQRGIGCPQIMTQKPNIVDMCDSLSAPLSSNNAQACNMSVGDDYVDVDIPGMYSDLFGGCSSGACAAPGVVAY